MMIALALPKEDGGGLGGATSGCGMMDWSSIDASPHYYQFDADW
jgi:hypothetical protein